MNEEDDFKGPVNYEPGSADKVRVLIQRYEQGLPLWHPEDFTRGKYDYGQDFSFIGGKPRKKSVVKHADMGDDEGDSSEG
jgi:hypothetical protein